jgi:CDP-diacylglycerol---serine O-phosphatidyltransferase
MGGVIAVCLCVDGKPWWAGVAVLVGYIGDIFDGYVARKLGTSNQFGGEFDTIADHMSHIVAPAIIIYTVYRDVNLLSQPYGRWLAIFLAGCIIVSASVRHARNVVAPVEFKGVWAGLPRTVVGFLAIGYANAELAPNVFGGWWFGVALIPAMSIATLTRLPFPSHHMRVKLWYFKFFGILAFAVTIGFAIWKPQFLFDVLFFWMVGYSLGSWMTLPHDQRDDYWAAVAKAKQVARAKSRG